MDNYLIFIGLAAGILTGISLLPQLVKIIQTKKAEDLSWGMLFVLLGGIILWIVYGILKNDVPIIATNSLSLVINVLIIIFSLKYRVAKNKG